MNRLICSPHYKPDRWSAAALAEMSPAQIKYVNSMIWSNYGIAKARISGGSKNDLEITFTRTLVLFANAETDNPLCLGMSEEIRSHVVSKSGEVSKGQVNFKWRLEPKSAPTPEPGPDAVPKRRRRKEQV